MNTWNVGVSATLDKPIPAEDAQHLAVLIADDALAFARHQGERFGVGMQATGDPWDALDQLRRAMVAELGYAGYRVAAWEAAEVLSPAEVERRTAAAGMPELINTGQFAKLLGVSQQRVSQLDTERRAAAEEGREHRFPAPVVPGWWVRAGAERYAATRRGPGRPRRGE